MKDEIRKLFPLEFYINDKGEMVSEISLIALNMLADEVNKIQKLLDFEIERNDIKQDIIDKANNKLQTMFDNGNEETILDDLLELKDILKGNDEE